MLQFCTVAPHLRKVAHLRCSSGVFAWTWKQPGGSGSGVGSLEGVLGLESSKGVKKCLSPLTCWVVWGFGFTVAGSAFGQAAGTSGSVSVSTKDGATSDASASATEPKPAASAPEPFNPYEPGLPPEGNVLELGVFRRRHLPELSITTLRYQAYPQQEYSPGGEFGARLGYYPASFVGLEGEAMAAASKVKNTETSAALYALRGQLVLQAPLPYVAPFILGGFGHLGAISRAMANDSDPAWHFGIGAKVPLTPVLSARLDLRDTLTKNTQQDGQAQTFEVLIGLFATVERGSQAAATPAAR